MRRVSASSTKQKFSNAVESYLVQLRKVSLRPDASGELSHRPAFHTFLKTASSLLAPGIEITFLTEPKRKEFGVPDFKVMSGHSQVGYIETKALGTDLDSVMATEQMERYKQLPKIILTNYLEFRLRQTGATVQPVKLCSLSDLRSDSAPESVGVEMLWRFLEAFLKTTLRGEGTAEELAEQMAWRTHLMRDAMLECLRNGSRLSAQLQGQLDAFRQVLIHDLSPDQFADIYAQTVAYGLFAARHQSVRRGRLDTLTNGFSLKSAERLVPKANPLLRGLFKELADEDNLDPRWSWHASDIADLLGASNMRAISEDMGKEIGREDPIVHFYEMFLKRYDPKIRETRGVYYTPEPVVSYIVRSVDHLLKEDFGKPDGLADKSVMILDPAVGTGTFLTGAIKHLHKVITDRGQEGTWPDFVRSNLLPRLFGFELLMAPYSIAHLKVGMLLEEYGCEFAEGERLHIYLTNTLEGAAGVSDQLAFGFGKTLSDEAKAANEIKADKPIMVIIGNPPYSGHSMNPSRVKVNGRWRKTWIGELIEDYRKVAGKPLGERNPKWLQDDYVKFMRFAQWRIQRTGHGIVSMITNHGYLDNPTFRGMRQSLMDSFDEIYVLDLHGNVKKKETAPDGSKDQNVFEIQQGVAISILVDLPEGAATGRAVSHGHIWGNQEGKYDWLNEHQVGDTDWAVVTPSARSYWFVPRDTSLEREYRSGWKITDAMPVHGVGLTTARDHVVIDFEQGPILERARLFRESTEPDTELCRRLDMPMKKGWDISKARALIQKEAKLEEHIRPITYRPFDNRLIFYHDSLVWRTVKRIMQHMHRRTNISILFHRREEILGDYGHFLCTQHPSEHGCLSSKTTDCQAPLYLYPQEPERNISVTSAIDDYRDAFVRATAANNWDARRVIEEVEHATHSLFPEGGYPRWPNFDPFFLDDIRRRTGITFLADGRGDLCETFGPEDVFAYIYSVFHSPTYRTRYAEFLKIDFPRVPLTSNPDLFRELCLKGHELVDLHLMRDKRLDDPCFWGTSYPVSGKHDVTCVDYRPPGDVAPGEDKQIERGRVYINKAGPRKGIKAEYFEGIAPNVWQFRIGGYQVLDHWLKERKKHKRCLTLEDIEHFQKVVAVLRETIRLMEEIDEVIDEHGGWPDVFQGS